MTLLLFLLGMIVALIYGIVSNITSILFYTVLSILIAVLFIKLLQKYPRAVLIILAIAIVGVIYYLANRPQIEAGNIDVSIYIATEDCKLYVNGAESEYMIIPKGSVIARYEDPTSLLEGRYAASMLYEPMCTWYTDGQTYSYRINKTASLEGLNDWNAVEVDSMKYRTFIKTEWWNVSLAEQSSESL